MLNCLVVSGINKCPAFLGRQDTCLTRYPIDSYVITLFYAEPVHRAAEETSLVEGATNLEDVALNLHRAVVGLAVTWVVDCSSGVFAAVLLEAAEHVKADELALAERCVRVEAVDCRSAVCLSRVLKPYDLSTVGLLLLRESLLPRLLFALPLIPALIGVAREVLPIIREKST